MVIFLDGARYHTSLLTDAVVQEYGLRAIVNQAACPEFNAVEKWIGFHKAVIAARLNAGK
jgi:hypothetical protein